MRKETELKNKEGKETLDYISGRIWAFIYYYYRARINQRKGKEQEKERIRRRRRLVLHLKCPIKKPSRISRSCVSSVSVCQCV